MKEYTVKEFDVLYNKTPLDDLHTLVGTHVVWRDGERVQVRQLDNMTLVIPASLPCARCGIPSDRQYLVASGRDGWTLIVDENGTVLADMTKKVYVCDTNRDNGGEFIDSEDIGFSMGALGGLMGMTGGRIGIGFIIRMPDGEEQDDDDDVMRLNSDMFGGKRPPGWSGGDGRN
jgi:hypothetical protein